jgi:hypothetical protein
MRSKKASAFVLALLAVLLIPISTAHAALSKVGTYSWHYNQTLGAYVTSIPTFTSDGGDVKICLPGGYYPARWYDLKEFDESNADEKIGSSALLGSGNCYTWRVSGYGDGTNGKAEIYVQTYTYPGSDTVTIYD